MKNNTTMNTPFPSHIRKIAIIAPAGSPDAEKVQTGIKCLESFGIKTLVMPGVFSKNKKPSYLAAPLHERLHDLHTAWSDTSVDAILCARGGFGSGHLLPHLDWNLLKSRNIPLLGYSDITALHLAMLSQGVSTPITAPMCCDIAEALIHPLTVQSLTEALNVSNHGKPQVAANLTVLCSLIGTPYLPPLNNTHLFIEDIGEDVYKIDRMLTQLIQAGVITDCASVNFGHFTDNGNNNELKNLFERLKSELNVPIKIGLPFGHTRKTLCFHNRLADSNV